MLRPEGGVYLYVVIVISDGSAGMDRLRCLDPLPLILIHMYHYLDNRTVIVGTPTDLPLAVLSLLLRTDNLGLLVQCSLRIGHRGGW